MSHAIPVSATSSDPAQPVGDLIAELFWVTADGRIEKDLGRVPVQNGVAVVDDSPLPTGLSWAIRIQRAATPGAVFRSGPLRRLPGPPSQVRPTGVVSFLVGGVSTTLSTPGGDGLPELVAEHLQNLPAPLQFVGVDLSADPDGNYVVTLRGQMRLIVLRLPFTYRRALRLVGSLDPGRPARSVIATPVGTAAIRGASVRPYAATLDRLIKEAVERQLAEAARWMATLLLELADAPFRAETVSVSELVVRPTGPSSAALASMTLGAGAITGVVLPPVPAVLDHQ